MSKLVYVCARDVTHITSYMRGLETIAIRLMPDNIAPARPTVLQANGILVGISNPSNLVKTRGPSVCAGYLIGSPDWDRPLTARPDGAYALFRADDQHVEILADTLASRTVWYFKNDLIFVASTSQRAIVALLGTFSFNSDVVPWLLASGTLGPGLSWDRRITHLGPATSLLLDRRSWTLTTKVEPARFSVLEATDEAHTRRLRTSLKNVISAASLERGEWALTLSGGIDCRTILCLLNDTAGLRAVTWGLRASQWGRNNDAYVARTLSRHYRLDYNYYETDLSQEPIQRVFERYTACGEGRIDHISGYMDGFQLWKKLYESGIRGVIRGDQVFGRKSVSSPQDVRASAGMRLWSDLASVGLLEDYGVPPQKVPDSLVQQPHESLETWRDSLQQHYRVPFVLAALSDLKLPYVEIASPMLSGSLVEEVRKLPDHLRTNKVLLRSIAHSLSPDVGFARYAATEPATGILKSHSVATFLSDTLSASSNQVVPRKFIEFVLHTMTKAKPRSKPQLWRTLKRSAASYAPAWMLRRGKKKVAEPPLDANQLAFRVYLICRMNEMLTEDAAILCKQSA